MVSRIVGSTVNEDVPVPCAALPQAVYRKRLRQQRKKGAKPTDESRTAMQCVLGEAADSENLFPDDAKELTTGNASITAQLKPVRDVVQEPSYPGGDKEALMTPQAALTAPDVTPEAEEQIDPSAVPGLAPATSFDASELGAEGTVPQANSEPRVNPMDVLLNRRGASAAAAKPNEQPSPAITAEAAAALFASPLELGGAEPQPNVPMPPHKEGDGKRIMEVYRKYA